MTIRCANCGQEHYTRPIVDLGQGVMVWQWRAVRIDEPFVVSLLIRLCEDFRVRVLKECLIEALWPDPDREPTYTDECLRVYVTRARNLVRPLGLEIRNEWGFGYELRPIEPVRLDRAKAALPVARSECLESA